MPAVAAAPAALLLGSAIVSPPSLLAAALGGVLTAAVLALWQATGDYGGADRVFALTVLPPWIGFIAVVGAIGAAVGQLAGAEDVVDKVPSTVVVVLAPAALAASVAVAARAAKGAPGSDRWWPALKRRSSDALALLASRFLVALGIAGGMVPGEWLGLDTGFAGWDSRRTILFGAALVLGLGASFFARRGTTSITEPSSVELSWVAPAPRSGTISARILVWTSLALAVGAIGTVGWFTFEGLRLGFL